MPTYVYTARRLNGQDVQGELTAANRRDAMSILSSRSLFPVRVTDQQPNAVQALEKFRATRVKPELVATTLSQLSDLLGNGVPLLESLKLLAEQSPHAGLAQVMTDVHDHVAEGETLEQAVARHPHVFSSLTVSMIRAGSEGAFLEEALVRVAKFLELQEDLKGRVKGAMVYPVILMTVGSIVTLGLIIFFVPKFEGLFQRLESRGAGLPMATEILLAISDVLIGYGWLIAALLVPAVWGIMQLMQSKTGQAWSDRIKLRLPLAGKIFHDTAVSRFCRVLGTLLRNGVPILKALQISAGSVGNQVLATAIRDSAENISAGETLSAPLADCGLIPPTTMAMIRIAEESNSLDSVLVSIADGVDQRIEKQLNLMVRLVEPIMLVVIGVVILFVMVALLLPIIEASTTF